MVFYILDRDERIIGTLSNTGFENPTLLAAEETKILNGSSNLSFTASNVDTDFIREENYVLYKNDKGVWDLYIIKEITELHSEGFTKTVMCEHGSQELIDHIPGYVIGDTVASPYTIISKALKDTRWSIGNIHAPEIIHSIGEVKEDATALGIIHAVADAYDLEIKFEITVDGKKYILKEFN
ncbi:MAG: phage tail protein, partial [Erysipelotrichaceae bacterium]|nr:phage tail protein [Erysipelotrichaceae bacterium]